MDEYGYIVAAGYMGCVGGRYILFATERRK